MPLFAILAFGAFLIGLVLDFMDVTADYGWLLWAGLALLALHMFVPVPVAWRRQP